MTRRELFGYAAGFASAAALRAQTNHDAPPIRDYARCLPDYLRRLAAEAYQRRNQRIQELKTSAAVEKYQVWVRETFLKLAGGVPERSPLNVRMVGAFERESYRVEKLVYESQPGLFVAANLYLPKRGSAPFPGVLFQLGHSTNGKSYGPYQRCCQGLAQLGYMVLAFDTMGQGERTNYPREGGWLTRLRSADSEHSVPGCQMLLIGETATRMQLWDAVRSLDVLASHPQVDAKRLASTGQSGGATLTMMLGAFDDRLAACAVCSGNTENVACKPFYPPGSTDDAEQDFIGSGAAAFDRWDLLWRVAPKPLLITVSTHDFFGTYSPAYVANGREEFAKLKKAYAVLGAADRLRWIENPLPHGLTYSSRIAVYDWFERWLKHSDRRIEEEPPTNPESDEMLWCGPTGNTVRDFKGKTPFAMTRERSQSIRTSAHSPDLQAMLAIEQSPQPPKLEVLSRSRYATCEIQSVEVNTAESVWAPAWVFLPKRPWTRMLIVVEPNGRNGRWREGELYDQLAASGVAVCAPDVRGIGDLRPEYSPGAAGYMSSHETEEDYAWSSLILGRSLLGQRTADIVATTRALATAHPDATFIVAARDKMTIPALCAAVLEPRISKLYLAGHLASWRTLLDSEIYTHTLANFAWEVLRVTDLPELARSIAPRIAIVAGAVDGSGKAIPAGTLYANYRESAVWDAATLSEL